MSQDHSLVPIIPARDLDESQSFYGRLGFTLVSDYGHYRCLADEKGAYVHLRAVSDWPAKPEDNPLGLYFYTANVDAAAESFTGHILGKGVPERTHWGTYEFAVSDPIGTLVRVGQRI